MVSESAANARRIQSWERRPISIAHLSSWICQPAFGLGYPFLAARNSASISAFAFAFASVAPIAQTVMRMRPALKTKRRSVACLPAVSPPRKQARAVDG